MLAFRQSNDKFLDKCSHVAVGYHLAFPLLHRKHRCRNDDIHIILHLYLTGKTPVILQLTTRKMHCLGRESLSPALFDLKSALPATTFAATGGRKEDIVVGHCRQQRLAGRRRKLLLAIHRYCHIAALHKLFLCEKQHQNQQQCHTKKEAHACANRKPSPGCHGTRY